MLFTLISSALSAAVSLPEFGYSGSNGPDNWANLSPAFKLCGTGKEQSPIDINDNTLVNIVGLRKNALAVTWSNVSRVDFINEDNLTVKLDIKNSNNKINFEQNSFTMANIHVHQPSEHLFRGEQTPMEIHMVHQAPSGELLVVGFFVKVRGESNEFLASLAQQLPKETPTKVNVSFDSILQATKNLESVYNYRGSLTTPPCSEGVNWIVSELPLFISQKDLDAFKSVVPFSARPAQRK